MGQHYVPQTHIRQFTGPDGKVAEMLVPALQVTTRRRSPKAVFARDAYYDDEEGTTMDPAFGHVETRLGNCWNKLINGTIRDALADTSTSAVFLHWVASSLSRSPEAVEHLEHITSISVRRGMVPDDVVAAVNEKPRVLELMVRRHLWRRWRDMLLGGKWRWLRTKYCEQLILTDNAIFRSTWDTSGRMFVLVPVSSHVLVIGAHVDDISAIQFQSARAYNLVAVEHANDRVIAASAETLQQLRTDLEADSGAAGLAEKYKARLGRLTKGVESTQSRAGLDQAVRNVERDFE